MKQEIRSVSRVVKTPACHAGDHGFDPRTLRHIRGIKQRLLSLPMVSVRALGSIPVRFAIFQGSKRQGGARSATGSSDAAPTMSQGRSPYASLSSGSRTTFRASA